jgi:hypothetical protein
MLLQEQDQTFQPPRHALIQPFTQGQDPVIVATGQQLASIELNGLL